MINNELLEIVRCPTCERGELEHESGNDEAEQLTCRDCGSSYPVHRGVPAMIPYHDLTSAAWKEWEEHLAKFRRRRELRVKKPEATINRFARKSRPQPPFAEFAGIHEGRVLDVGCGPGRFRRYIDLEHVSYVGIDPIVIPAATDFTLVRGLAEYLPFHDETFTDVVVLAALDHFRDTDRFFSEARRVLRPGGRFHIMQGVHEVRGPVSAVRVLTHLVKDGLEDLATSSTEAPKHLSEYTEESLRQAMEPYFDVVNVGRYHATWYSPDKLFLTAAPSP